MKIVMDFELEDSSLCDGCPLYYDTISCLARFKGWDEQHLSGDVKDEDYFIDKRPQDCMDRFGK